MNYPSVISGHMWTHNIPEMEGGGYMANELHLKPSIFLSLSAVPDNDAGCGYASPESNKNRCGFRYCSYFALGGKKNKTEKKHGC